MTANRSQPRARRGRMLTPTLIASVLMLVLAGPVLAGTAQGYLGIYLQELDEALSAALDLNDDDGVLVTRVIEDSPAAKAGLLTGDVVLALNGEEADGVKNFTQRIRNFAPGDKIELSVLRKGQQKSISVELGEAEEKVVTRIVEGDAPHAFFLGEDGDLQVLGEDGAEGEFDIEIFKDGDEARVIVMGKSARPSLGVEIHKFDENLGKYFGATKGVLVLGVIEDSAAEKAGILSGDVILTVGDQEIAEMEDIFAALDDHEAGDKVNVQVLRSKKKKTIEVELEAGQPFEFSRRMQAPHFDRSGPHGGPQMKWHGMAPRPRVETRIHRQKLQEHREQLRQELDSLREELRELREKLESEKGER